MKDRICYVRKQEKLSQTEFADKLGLTKNFISLLENGNRIPSDRTISDICRIFDIEEDWLRHGLEPMRAERSRDEEIAELVSRALKGSADFKKAVIQMICSRTEDELEVLEKALRDVYEKIKKE
jgi:transcriptional regulator with XRE-family HTH domain